jgi:hypothetical protein
MLTLNAMMVTIELVIVLTVLGAMYSFTLNALFNRSFQGKLFRLSWLLTGVSIGLILAVFLR